MDVSTDQRSVSTDQRSVSTDQLDVSADPRDVPADQQTEIAQGKPITTDFASQRAHLCCSDIASYFPEHAELFQRRASLLKDVDRALAQQDLAIQRFNENVKKLSDMRKSRSARPRNVRH